MNDSQTFSYYFDRIAPELYNVRKKEKCVRDYIMYMLCRTQKMFEYKGLPDTIPKRMLESYLQINGFACIAEYNGKLYAYWGGLGGEPDEYYQPTLCVVSNPYQKLSKNFKIGEDCVIVRGDSYYLGLIPLFTKYATAMNENDISFSMATVITRMQALLSAPDDSTRESAKKYLDDLVAGEFGVVASNEFLDGIKVQPMVSSQRTFTDLIEYQQYLKASWYNEIGLNANYNMKREKLSTTESQMNSDALLPLVDDMLEQRRLGVEAINKMFGTNITVEFSSSWLKLIEEFQSNQLDGDVNESGADNRADNQADEEVESSDGDGTDRAGEEVSGSDGGETSGDSSGNNDTREELREDGESEDASGELDESGGTDSRNEEDSESESEESESNQLDSGDVEVTVNVEVNVDETGKEDIDRSSGEDSDESLDSDGNKD